MEEYDQQIRSGPWSSPRGIPFNIRKRESTADFIFNFQFV